MEGKIWGLPVKVFRNISFMCAMIVISFALMLSETNSSLTLLYVISLTASVSGLILYILYLYSNSKIM